MCASERVRTRTHVRLRAPCPNENQRRLRLLNGAGLQATAFGRTRSPGTYEAPDARRPISPSSPRSSGGEDKGARRGRRVRDGEGPRARRLSIETQARADPFSEHQYPYVARWCVVKTIPETIENRWDILYRDYPEIYEEFASVPKQPPLVDVIRQCFALDGKMVVDVGSGTGRSTFQFARYAQSVIGVEPEAAMRDVAVRLAGEKHIDNVRFVPGAAQGIPLPDGSADVVVAVTAGSLHDEENIAAFSREAERVVREGGAIFSADIASGWYGGDLASVIAGLDTGLLARDEFFPKYGYERLDYFALQDYGSVEAIIKTYGFIFGRNAIDYIREHHKTVVKWKISIHHRLVG